MIKPVCVVCDKELKKFGAILLSPPNEDNLVEKFHICVSCFEEIKYTQANKLRQKYGEVF